MAEREKGNGFLDKIKNGFRYISQILSAGIILPIEDRILRIEKRIMRKMHSLLVIGFGAVLLIFSLFFFFKEFLGWGNAAAFFVIGIVVFIIGLLLKIAESG